VRARRDDVGAVVLGWFTKLVLVLGMLGLLGFDGISHDVQLSYNAALAAVAGNGDTIETTTFAIAPTGAVSLVLHRTAATLWMKDVGPLRGWTDISAKGEGAPTS